jgi:hypothetical protein
MNLEKLPSDLRVLRVKSLRHVSLREMGWSRNPTSPDSESGSQGQAT